jgi:hypothetical protein
MRTTDVGIVYPPTDLRPGLTQVVRVTLSATPGELTQIALPDTALGVRLYPYGQLALFALMTPPDALQVVTDLTIPVTEFGIGAIAREDSWTQRILPPAVSHSGRLLYLRSAVPSLVVDVEVF